MQLPPVMVLAFATPLELVFLAHEISFDGDHFILFDIRFERR